MSAREELKPLVYALVPALVALLDWVFGYPLGSIALSIFGVFLCIFLVLYSKAKKIERLEAEQSLDS